MDRYGFTATDIWIIDETGVSTVLKPYKIVAAKGKRNVGAMTSGERETNVTVVPPMFVFPRKHSIEAQNASGWVTAEELYQFMQYFIKYVKPSMEYPVLLVLDNHSSRLNVKTLTLAIEN